MLLAAPLALRAETYVVTIRTATQRDAGSNATGTDANVDIQFIGSTGESEWVRLDRPGYNEFESGTNDSVSVTADDMGTLQAIRLRHDNTGHKPGWAVEYVDVKKGTAPVKRAPCYRWLASDEDDHAIQRELAFEPAIVYSVRVTTANVDKAGTDANVYVRLASSQWDSYNRLLDDPSRDDFERGSIATYPLTFRNLGNPMALTCHIGHDNTNKNAGWCVSEVLVTATYGSQQHLWRWRGQQWLESSHCWATLSLTREY